MFRKMLLCLVLGAGPVIGVPMRPEEIEELMHSMNQPVIAITIPDERHNDEELCKPWSHDPTHSSAEPQAPENSRR